MLPVTYTLGEPSVSWIDCEYIWLRVHLGDDAQEQADLAVGGNSISMAGTGLPGGRAGGL